jgi:uncharacterized protein YndB with AHSA1/START domain
MTAAVPPPSVDVEEYRHVELRGGDMDTGTRGATAPILTFDVSVHIDVAPEITFGVLADPRTHLEWTGTEAPRDDFKLLSLDAADGPVRAGSVFTSTGANGMGMVFHDRSEVTEVLPPRVFAFTTASHLVRKHREDWQARFEHRYEVGADATGSRVRYTARVFPLNYRPFWLHPVMRPLTRTMVGRFMAANLRQLGRLAERTAAADAEGVTR